MLEAMLLFFAVSPAAAGLLLLSRWRRAERQNAAALRASCDELLAKVKKEAQKCV